MCMLALEALFLLHFLSICLVKIAFSCRKSRILRIFSFSENSFFSSSFYLKHVFFEKETNKDFSFNARELVTKAGSGKTWERESLF